MSEDRPVIMIVDDDEMNLEMAQAILEARVNAEFLQVTSGRQCLHILKLRRGKVDLLLLDVAMPSMDGLETLEKIREQRGWEKIPVIMLTASADKGTIIKASRLGIHDYVRKPFEPEDLVARVKKELAIKQLDSPELQDVFRMLDKL